MREYEVTYLISDEVAETDLKKITEKVAGIIGNEGGNVKKEEIWGRRKLTYPIKKQIFATYITCWFELPREKIVNIDHEFRVNSQIIRHLIIVKITKHEDLVVSKEDITETKDVEKILGEKSFEIIEGETEESRDLMAKRKKEDEKESPVVSNQSPDDEPKKQEKAKKVTEEKPVEKEQKAEAKEETSEKPAEIKEKAKIKPKKVEKEVEKEKEEDEADRIKKLDEKLDELLKDDL